MRKWLKQIKGEHIAFTGKAWRIRRDLQKDVHRQGGVATSKPAFPF